MFDHNRDFPQNFPAMHAAKYYSTPLAGALRAIMRLRCIWIHILRQRYTYTSTEVNIAQTSMADISKTLKKLKSHPDHKAKTTLELEQLAIELTTPETVRRRFAPLLEAGQAVVWKLAEEDDEDLLHSLEFEAQHERMKQDTTKAVQLPVKLSLQKLRNVPTPSVAYSFAALLKFEYGPLHSAVIVGNVLIEWGREGIVEPRPCDHMVSEFQANCASLGEWSGRVKDIQTEMSLANRQRNTEKKIDILCKSLEEKGKMIDKLVDVIIDYNRNKQYHVFKCNCQDFARDALAALGIKKPVEFSGKLQKRFMELKKGKIKVEAQLETHENLDAYVEREKDELSRHDLEYLQCLYFNFHLPAIEKSYNPEAWVCDIPTCRSAELDTLIRERQLSAATQQNSSRKRVASEATRRSPPSSTRNSTATVTGTDRGTRHQSISTQKGSPQQSATLQGHTIPPHTDQTLPCINNCGLMGDKDKAGLCATCFDLERQATRDKESKQVNTTPPVTQELPVVGNAPTVADSEDVRVQCPTPGCRFYGTPQSNFYCSNCFDPNKAAPKCKECQNYFASPEYLGLCHSCFLKKTKAESSPPTKPKNLDPPPAQGTHGHHQQQFIDDQSISTQKASPQQSATLQGHTIPPHTDQTLPCINNCGLMGDKDKAGLCATCFDLERQAARDKESKQVNTTPPVTQELPVVGNTPAVADSEDVRVQCPTPGCRFYGTPQSNFYCSNCFDPNKAAPKCKECQNYFASPEYLGLCHSCFLKKTKAESSPLTKPKNFDPPPAQGTHGHHQQQFIDDQSISTQKASPQQSATLQGHTIPPHTDQTLPCINNCGLMGDKDKAGLCATCFDLERQAARDKESKQVNTTPPVTQELPVVGNTPAVADSEDVRVQCPTPGCRFYGTPQSNFYCSNCFDPNKAAPKCKECQNYFASPEYLGLCHSCFMFKTTLDTTAVANHVGDNQHAPSPPNQSQAQRKPFKRPYMPRYEKCLTQGCPHPKTETGYCDICNAKDSQQQSTIPSAHGSEAKRQPECYLCTGSELTEFNQVCAAHKELLMRRWDQDRRLELNPNQQVRWASESGYTPTKEPFTHQQGYHRNDTPQQACHENDTYQQGYHENNTHHQHYEVPHPPSTQSTIQTRTSVPNVWTDYQTPGAHTPSERRGSGTRELNSQICVTPGCSYRGYRELDLLCPLCYEDYYPDRKVPDTLPLV